MKISEVLLSLVAGAVLFSVTKMMSVSTSFTPAYIPSDQNAPVEINFLTQGPPGNAEAASGNLPDGSIAARQLRNPTTELLLQHEVSVLEKQKEALMLTVQEIKLQHERDERSRAVAIAEKMITAAGSEGLLSNSVMVPPTASVEPAAPAAATPTKASNGEDEFDGTVDEWCRKAAELFGIRPGLGWGSMASPEYRKVWKAHKCDSLVAAKGSAVIPVAGDAGLSAWCTQTATTHGVVSGQTWGTLPKEDRTRWKSSGCDSVAPVSVSASALTKMPPAEVHSQGLVLAAQADSAASRQPFVYLRSEGDQGPRRRVTVLVWNKIRGFLDWLRDDFTNDAKNKCSTECVFTDRRNALGSAEGVLFHTKTHSKNDFPRQRGRPGQKYMMVSLEQPAYAPLMKDRNYVNKFDYTMTYDLDSVLPVITIHPHYASREYFAAPSVPFEQKLDAAVMFTSNCKNAGAENRLKYYEELMKHMTVHSYGKCLHNKDEPPRGKLSLNENKRKVLSQYKWYLAFENNIIKDYVSEKVFDGILAGTVPVYYGATTVDKLLPSPGSVVKVSDFKSPRELAVFLNEVGKDKGRYEQYLRWKTESSQDQVDAFQRVIDMTGYKYTSLCRICHRLASDIPEQQQ